jgi:hypothetical protein
MRRFATGCIVAAMVLAACGGSSSKSSTGTGAANSSGGGTTAGGNSGGGNTGTKDLSKAKIKITYTTSGTDGSSTTLTIAQDGNGKSSFSTSDLSTDSTDPTAVSTIYSDGQTNVSCEGTGTTAHCQSLPAAEASIATSVTSAFSAIASLTKILGGGDKSSESIAGRDADCVKYKASDVIGKLATLPLFKGSDTKASDYDPNDTATICIDKDTGFPLKFSGTKKGAAEDTIVATAVGDPSDSDFTPPVTPEAAPTLPGGVTIPSVPSG